MYNKIKKQNGEKFAQTLRNYHNGLLEIPEIDKVVRHAGRDAEPLLPYLMSVLASNDDELPAPAPEDPFVLLDRARYEAFHADTLEKQNSIKSYFKKSELLCTFNDHSRYKNYHMVHAIKKDVDGIGRENFNGKEKREDEYGTSVISIQMLKEGGFISIKNRYNHSVQACDNTFGSNPDNIIEGLSAALKEHFNVEFTATGSLLPDEYVPIGDQIFNYHTERNNIYYADQVWAQDGIIHEVNKSAGDALFDGYLFDNKTKTLKKIDPELDDSFADDFNHCYGGNKGLQVQRGNLTLNGEILIGAEHSQIKSLYLPEMTAMGDDCLVNAHALERFEAPALTTMGGNCLCNAYALKHFEAPALITMGSLCLFNANALTHFEAPALTTMGYDCLGNARALEHFEAPVLTTMDNRCLGHVHALERFEAPALTSMGDSCLYNAYALEHFEAPALTSMGNDCLGNAYALEHFEAQALTFMGNRCLRNARALKCFEVPVLTTKGNGCLGSARAIEHFLGG